MRHFDVVIIYHEYNSKKQNICQLDTGTGTIKFPEFLAMMALKVTLFSLFHLFFNSLVQYN
jgi:hypothetical protein